MKRFFSFGKQRPLVGIIAFAVVATVFGLWTVQVFDGGGEDFSANIVDGDNLCGFASTRIYNTDSPPRSSEMCGQNAIPVAPAERNIQNALWEWQCRDKNSQDINVCDAPVHPTENVCGTAHHETRSEEPTENVEFCELIGSLQTRQFVFNEVFQKWTWRCLFSSSTIPLASHCDADKEGAIYQNGCGTAGGKQFASLPPESEMCPNGGDATNVSANNENDIYVLNWNCGSASCHSFGNEPLTVAGNTGGDTSGDDDTGDDTSGDDGGDDTSGDTSGDDTSGDDGGDDTSGDDGGDDISGDDGGNTGGDDGSNGQSTSQCTIDSFTVQNNSCGVEPKIFWNTSNCEDYSVQVRVDLLRTPAGTFGTCTQAPDNLTHLVFSGEKNGPPAGFPVFFMRDGWTEAAELPSCAGTNAGPVEDVVFSIVAIRGDEVITQFSDGSPIAPQSAEYRECTSEQDIRCLSFTPQKPQYTEGERVLLQWRVTSDVDYVQILGANAPGGDITTSPVEITGLSVGTYTYDIGTFSQNGTIGESCAPLSVQVVPAPQCSSNTDCTGTSCSNGQVCQQECDPQSGTCRVSNNCQVIPGQCGAPQAECQYDSDCGGNICIDGQQCAQTCENNICVSDQNSCQYVVGSCGIQCTQSDLSLCGTQCVNGAVCQPTCDANFQCSASTSCQEIVGQCGISNPIKIDPPVQTILVGQTPLVMLISGGESDVSGNMAYSITDGVQDGGTGLTPVLNPVSNMIEFLGTASGPGEMEIPITDGVSTLTARVIVLARPDVASGDRLEISSVCDGETKIVGEICTLVATLFYADGTEQDVSDAVEWRGWNEVGEFIDGDENGVPSGRSDLRIIEREITSDPVTIANITASLTIDPDTTPPVMISNTDDPIQISVVDPQRLTAINIASECDGQLRFVQNVCILEVMGTFEDGTEHSISNIAQFPGASAIGETNALGELQLTQEGVATIRAFVPYNPDDAQGDGLYSENVVVIESADEREVISFDISVSPDCVGQEVYEGEVCVFTATATFADNRVADISQRVIFQGADQIGDFVDNVLTISRRADIPETRAVITARLEQSTGDPSFDDRISDNTIEIFVGERAPEIRDIYTLGNRGVAKGTQESLYIRLWSPVGESQLQNIEALLIGGQSYAAPSDIPANAPVFQIVQAGVAPEVEQEPGENNGVYTMITIPVLIPDVVDLEDGDSTFLVRIITASGNEITATGETYIGIPPNGDVTRDGRFTLLDIVTMMRAINGELSLSEDQVSAADFNQNQELDLVDVIRAARELFAN